MKKIQGLQAPRGATSLLLWENSQRWPSSKTSGCPRMWLMASSSKGIHWPLTQERLSLTPSSIGQVLAYNFMTISGWNLAMGDVSWAHRLWAISFWNLAYSSFLSWTRLFLRNDQPLMASNRCWWFALLNLCPSKSISACEAALEPSQVAFFLDLLVGSFFGTISCKDTFVKLVYKNHQFITIKAHHKKKWCTLFPNKCKCQHVIRKTYISMHGLFYDKCKCTYIHLVKGILWHIPTFW